MFAKLKELREEQEGGFTLIELLVVILIIGILAAIAIPLFLNQRKSAVDSSVQSDVKNAASQVETWMVKNPAINVPGFTVGSDGDSATNPTPVAPPAGSVLADIKVGNGTELNVTAGATIGTYKIKAINKGGDGAVAGITYDSNLGGLNK